MVVIMMKIILIKMMTYNLLHNYSQDPQKNWYFLLLSPPLSCGV